eukprot:CAMPEP_0204551684 /NCGR_PEP_ID=MMETSP0661-20131031/26069_1 /ASSEMBLY_ACC=CAM_ASM_000606 /TAXON_ID=109239 /ORGANISM="Alexandrium margalefi, Strain AMGDE01CS-322" /LENGTH=81 /DNA_ID=CAMNT_0051558677 /DNA_START=27 /DNA_END=269 /DNA_ORIENTATION=+
MFSTIMPATTQEKRSDLVMSWMTLQRTSSSSASSSDDSLLDEPDELSTSMPARLVWCLCLRWRLLRCPATAAFALAACILP